MLELNIKNKKTLALDNNEDLREKTPYEFIKEDVNEVNKFIINKLRSDVPLIPIISEHLLKSGGKRIRPSLTILF